MENFAEYILNEEDLMQKMEITYYLSRKKRILFDKSIIFKTEIARAFLNYAKLDVDKNLVLTACLLCNCKKVENAQNIESVHTYAKRGAEYLATLGFEKNFCNICEQVNRYSYSNPRSREGDILELVDEYGGLLLDRPERSGFKPDEALVLLENRNLKDYYNQYLEELVNMTALKRLVKIYNETEDVVKFMKEVGYTYQPKLDKLMEKHMAEVTKEMFKKVDDPNRPLFSQETTRKIMNHIREESMAEVEVKEK